MARRPKDKHAQFEAQLDEWTDLVDLAEGELVDEKLTEAKLDSFYIPKANALLTRMTVPDVERPEYMEVFDNIRERLWDIDEENKA